MDVATFRSELEALAYRYHVHHPFDQLLQSGRASREMLRMWAANRYYYQDTIPRKDACIVANCPRSDVRGAWVQHVVTHDVDGALGEWLLLTNALGLEDEEVRSLKHLLPGTKFACDAYLTFCREAPWQEAMCASMTHLFAGDIHRTRLAHWPSKYPWLPEKAFSYFEHRVRTLPGEVDYSLRTLCDHFGTEDGLARANEILRFKQDVLWSMLDALWHHFFSPQCRMPTAPASSASSSSPSSLQHTGPRLRILGSGAGGGTPQWNKTDARNDAARHGCAVCRTQCSAAVLCGPDVLLVNCSPDVRAQWNDLLRAHPEARLRAVLLTDAQLDHVTGLLSLREMRSSSSSPLHLLCTEAVRETLEEDLRLLPTLRAHGVTVHVTSLRDAVPIHPFPDSEEGKGVSLVPHVLARTRPRYARRDSDVLALSLPGERCYAPCLPDLSPSVLSLFASKRELWLDGTFATAEEMPDVQGHVPMCETNAKGAECWPHATVHFVHLNHTNPEGETCGARDGDEWAL